MQVELAAEFFSEWVSLILYTEEYGVKGVNERARPFSHQDTE